MLLIIVATGNHFFVDAALGGLVVVIGWLIARSVVASPVRRLPHLAPRRHVRLRLTANRHPACAESRTVRGASRARQSTSPRSRPVRHQRAA